MVFWATVLSFIMGILYYAMYPLSSTLPVIEQPKAEAFITPFFEQHQIARLYMRNQLIAIKDAAKVSNSIPNGITCDSTALKKLFLMPNTFNNYLTSTQQSNFEQGSVFPGANGGNFVSLLACLNRKDTDDNVGSLVDCTTTTSAVQYLVSYAYFDRDMMDINYFENGKLLWKNAILKRSHGSPECGYLTHNSSSGSYHINTSQQITRKVPQALADAIQPVLDLADKDDDNTPMVLFCLSALRHPYSENGLVLHLDGFSNQKTSSGLTHSNTTASWHNLVHNASSNTNATVGATDTWNAKNAAYLDLVAANTADDTESATLTNRVDTNMSQSSLGDTFTISMVVRYGESKDAYNTYGTDPKNTSSVDSSTESQVIGGRISGNTISFGINEAGYSTVNTVSTDIQLGDIITLTYMVNRQYQALYVNGLLVKEGQLNAEIGGKLTSANLMIGNDDNQSFRLYNFKIYNRQLDASEISRNHTTDEKRFDF